MGAFLTVAAGFEPAAARVGSLLVKILRLGLPWAGDEAIDVI